MLLQTHRLALAIRYPTKQTRSLDVVHLYVSVVIHVPCYLTCISDSLQRCRQSVRSFNLLRLVKLKVQKSEKVC